MSFTEIKQIHMNCEWSIKAFSQTYFTENQTEDLILKAYDIVASIEKEMTFFGPSSVTEINNAAGIRSVKVSKRLFQLIQRAINFSKQTNGYFDICYPSANESLRNSQLIVMNEDDCSVYLPDKEMKISLGGIGKGFAVDQVFNFLKSQGLVNFLVNGSGDLRCHTHPNAPRAWNLGISNPFDPSKTIGVLKLKNQAMASSGTYKKGQHIKTNEVGMPISVTLFAEGESSTEFCDIWGTYLCSLSCPDALEELNRYGLRGLIIDSSGNCYSSHKTQSSQESFNKAFKEQRNA